MLHLRPCRCCICDAAWSTRRSGSANCCTRRALVSPLLRQYDMRPVACSSPRFGAQSHMAMIIFAVRVCVAGRGDEVETDLMATVATFLALQMRPARAPPLRRPSAHRHPRSPALVCAALDRPGVPGVGSARRHVSVCSTARDGQCHRRSDVMLTSPLRYSMPSSATAISRRSSGCPFQSRAAMLTDPTTLPAAICIHVRAPVRVLACSIPNAP